jgi:glycosyltransferase involved in cell wall biosynthesis
VDIDLEAKNKHILLVSYVFPPYPGIGGRRWAKFAKYLAAKGFVVHVICAKNPFQEQSLFNEDIKNVNIKVYPVKANYPYALIKNTRSLIDKINYRLSLILMKLAIKGNYYDRAAFWKKQVLKESTKLIDEFNINTIIVSGAPFSLLHHLISLKRNVPSINLLGDLRDPWTWGVGYGMQTLSKKRKQVEHQKEKEVIELYDHIFMPTGNMKDHLVAAYPACSHKFHIIPHGYDTTEIQIIPKITSHQKRLLFYGTIYNGTNEIFREIIQVIHKLNGKVSLDIFTSSVTQSNPAVKQKLINYYKPVPPHELFSRFSNYDYVLIIQPDFIKDEITTKIYEIIYSQTTIILISNTGRLSDFILKHNLGYCIPPDSVSSILPTVIDSQIDTLKSTDFPIDDFSFESLSDQLIAYFK